MPAFAGDDAAGGAKGLRDCNKYAKYQGDICITGMSGRVGQARNLEDFKDLLWNKKHAFTEEYSRFDCDKFGTQKRHAYINDIDKFDSKYFDIDPKNANFLDPNIRLGLEATYEAIIDAGYSVEEVRGSVTGVYVSCVAYDANYFWGGKSIDEFGEKSMGIHNSFRASQVAHAFDLRGPNSVVDAACSGYLAAMELAMKDIRLGHCDRAIVLATQLHTNPMAENLFLSIGAAGPNGICYAFDERAEGLARGEAVGAMFLQKEEDARRVWSKLVHAYQSADGNSGDFDFNRPAPIGQMANMSECYRQANIDPQTIDFVECHGTGTSAGDGTEATAISGVFLGDRRKNVLTIGSVKTYVGHAEAAAGFNACVKCALGLNEGVIVPNINYERPNPNIAALVDGRMRVVTEVTPYPGEMVGINGFGLGGTDSHVILKKNDRPNKTVHPAREAPRLFTYGARTEEGLKNIINNVQKNAKDVGYQALLQASGNEPAHKMPFRGFTILNTDMKITEIKNIEQSAKKHPIVFAFTGMGCHWAGMGRNMMKIDLFSESVKKSCEILKKKHQTDVYQTIVTGKLTPGVESVVIITVIQVALVDMMNAMGIKPDYIVGHSLGEVAAGYADGALTREEAMLIILYIFRAPNGSPKTRGLMAAVGMSPEDLGKILPSDIDISCHNGEESVTIGGPTASVKAFIDELDRKNIFTKEVDSVGVGYHSRLLKPIEGDMISGLQKGGLVGKPRSSKWLSSSYPKSEWDQEKAKTAGADYYSDNIQNRVYFYDVVSMLPKDSLVIEIAPSNQLQSLLKGTIGSDSLVTSTMQKNHQNNVTFFYQNLGKMYLNGVNMKPLNIFQEVSFPVAQETPMISPLISKQWVHSDTFRVPSVDDLIEDVGGNAYSVTYDFSESGKAHYMTGHRLNGTKLFPATGYLKIAWETVAAKYNLGFENVPVVMEDVEILRATPLPEDGELTFTCRVMQTGEFELIESDALVVKGKICLAIDAPHIISEMEELDEIILQKSETEGGKKQRIPMTRDEIYLSFIKRGLDYSREFRSVLNAEGMAMDLEWKGEWVAHLDCILQASVIGVKGDSHIAPIKMDAIYLDASKLEAQISAGIENPLTRVLCDIDNMRYITCDHFKIKCPEVVNTYFNSVDDSNIAESRFVPYLADKKVDDNLRQYATACLNYTINGLGEAVKSGKFPLLSNNKQFVADAQKEFQLKATKSSDEYLSKACKLPGSGLAKTLMKIFPPHGTAIGPKDVSDILASSKAELAQDRLIDSLSSPDILRPALDIVKFNIADGKLAITEVDAVSSRVYRHAAPYLLARTGISYTATDKDDLPNDFKGAGLKAVKWDLASGTPAPKPQANLLILKNVLHKQDDVVKSLNHLLPAVLPGCFILVQEVTHNFPIFVALEGLHQDVKLPTTNGTREYGRFMTDSTWQTYFAKNGLDLVYRKSDGLLSTVYLLRKKHTVTPLEPTFMRIEGLDYAWLEGLQKEMKKLENEPKDSAKRLWLISETKNSGITGMVQSLRKEPGGDKVRFVFSSNLNGTIEKADVSEERLRKDLVGLDLYQNIFRDGQWGCIAIKQPIDYSFKNKVTSANAYVSVPSVGDHSSAKWINTNEELLAMDHFLETQDKDKYVSVYYAGINDRDVLQANGAIPKTKDLVWRFNHGYYGYEFAGRRNDGSRVVGLVPGLSLATGLNHSRGIVLDIPTMWTMKDAATVPYCYFSVYYSLVVRNPLTEGQTILVHSGATPMGTAAIRTALNVGATVYTTAYTEAERVYLKKHLPQIPESHVILRSEELSVTNAIEKLTAGQGVNVILSPDADESLFDESLTSLSKSGQFIEIGRPVSNQTVEHFASKLMQKNMTYKRVDAMMILNDKARHKRLISCVSNDMQKGIIQPIDASVFDATDISKAFTEASESRVLRKVLVQVRDEEPAKVSVPQEVNLPVSHRVACDPRKVYILCGGTGGFGLELAHWLAQRGAKNFILTSRRGITTGYQEYKTEFIKENYGADVKVVTTQIKSKGDAQKLLREAQQIGPIGGIFILSMVVIDKFLTQLTREIFAAVADAKIFNTVFLDEASREMCGSELDFFVPFSSISSNKGNAAQTNYNFGNSVQERTVEQRKADGLSGLAIQWGAVGDVGYFMAKTGMADREYEAMVENTRTFGVDLQRMESCLTALDTLLVLQNESVVSCIKPWIFESAAEKGAGKKKTTLVMATAKIFGISSMEALSDDITLGSQGLDSLMGVEMKQMLERDFGVHVSLVEVRKLSMGRLREIDAKADVAED